MSDPVDPVVAKIEANVRAVYCNMPIDNHLQMISSRVDNHPDIMMFRVI